MEKEIGSIFATLKEFCSMLLGANLHVLTNNQNLTFDTLKTQRVLRWHNKVEEFLPALYYIEGPHNILADNFSWLHCLVTRTEIAEGKNRVDPAVVSDDEDELYFLEQEYAGLNDKEILQALEYYLDLPEMPPPDHNPLNDVHIREQHQLDMKLLALQAKYLDNYVIFQLDDDIDNITCYKKDPTQGIGKLPCPNQWWLKL